MNDCFMCAAIKNAQFPFRSSGWSDNKAEIYSLDSEGCITAPKELETEYGDIQIYFCPVCGKELKQTDGNTNRKTADL